MISLTVDLKLETRRCWKCGKYWALESGAASIHGSTTCSQCQQSYINSLNHDLQKRDRSIISLRGAITKLRKKLHGRANVNYTSVGGGIVVEHCSICPGRGHAGYAQRGHTHGHGYDD